MIHSFIYCLGWRVGCRTLSIQIKRDMSIDGSLWTATQQGGHICNKQPVFQFIPQALHIDFDLLWQMKIPTNIHFGDTRPSHILIDGWATQVQVGKNSAKAPSENWPSWLYKEECCVSYYYLWAVGCAYFMSVLSCWCVYDVICTQLFLRNPVVKHLPPPPALGEPVTLYSEKQP